MKLRTLALALLTALGSAAAQASLVNFNGTLDAGPLAGDVFSGSYSFDDSALIGSGFESLDLLTLSLNFQSALYGLTAGATADFQDGIFLGLTYNTSAPAYTLSFTSGSFDLTDAFFHVQPLTGGIESSGGYTTAAALPEPASIALVLAGLGAVGLGRRRTVAA
jgi:opacity protein-like surface antigen